VTILIKSSAEVAEVVDAPGSGSGGRKPVGVRVSSSAPTIKVGSNLIQAFHSVLIRFFRAPVP
jgi:hypothetical protein